MCPQDVVLGGLGIQPQHCIIFNTLDPHDGGARRVAVVVRPAHTADVVVNGVRISGDTRLVHGDRWVCVGVGEGLCMVQEGRPLCPHTHSHTHTRLWAPPRGVWCLPVPCVFSCVCSDWRWACLPCCSSKTRGRLPAGLLRPPRLVCVCLCVCVYACGRVWQGGLERLWPIFPPPMWPCHFPMLPHAFPVFSLTPLAPPPRPWLISPATVS